MSMSSYRDPRTIETLKVFEEASRWAVTSGEINDRDIEEGLLRAFKSLDAPIGPSSRGNRFFLYGLDDSTRQVFREQLLGVGVGDIKRVAEQYLVDGMNQSSVTIVGSMDKVSVKHEEDGWEVLGADMKPFK
ncbi:hypothetical protein CYMTET_8749 [Cymbomonas tetramitiformis]|uniref:Insulinase family protein n=1 Tax=Cymbomonas tetramitiformis TaxID=36881 RepID=A0AAE0GSJ0_9CHLO|nr:hypothetical protein CYMTET_8749 [Cymbomonas tetramitiformis]